MTVTAAGSVNAASGIVGRRVHAQLFCRALRNGGHLVLPRIDEAVFERRDHDQVHEGEHRRPDRHDPGRRKSPLPAHGVGERAPRDLGEDAGQPPDRERKADVLL